MEFLSETKGKFIPCRRTDNRKSAGTNSGESCARNLEAESIRSRAESTGGCTKLKTVAEIRRSSARGTFIAESRCLFVPLMKGDYIQNGLELN